MAYLGTRWLWFIFCRQSNQSCFWNAGHSFSSVALPVALAFVLESIHLWLLLSSVNRLSCSCQPVVRQSNQSCFWNAGHSFSSVPLPVALAFELECQHLRLLLSSGCQAIFRQLSRSCQTVKPELLLKQWTLRLFCASACRLGHCSRVYTFTAPFVMP